MEYITGIHALNLACSLETCGDWHCSALRWENITFAESEDSVFRDYGIESGRRIPKHDNVFFVANHIRALLDLINTGRFDLAQGMKEDFIDNPKYTGEIFEKVLLLNKSANWDNINKFMDKEYGREWVNYVTTNMILNGNHAISKS